MSTQPLVPSNQPTNSIDCLRWPSDGALMQNLPYIRPKIRTAAPRIFNESKPHLVASNTSVLIDGRTSGTIVGKEEQAFGSNAYYLATSASALQGKVGIGRQSRVSVGSTIKVETPSGATVKAKVISISGDSNIAILQFESSSNYKVASLASPKAGSKVFSAGFAGQQNAPKGSVTHNGLSVTKEGVVTSTSGEVGSTKGYDTSIAVPTTSGMQGGGIFDADGNLIGMNQGGGSPFESGGGANIGELLRRQQSTTKAVSGNVVSSELKRAIEAYKNSCPALNEPDFRVKPIFPNDNDLPFLRTLPLKLTPL
jgi:hypothetical protein